MVDIRATACDGQSQWTKRDARLDSGDQVALDRSWERDDLGGGAGPTATAADGPSGQDVERTASGRQPESTRTPQPGIRNAQRCGPISPLPDGAVLLDEFEGDPGGDGGTDRVVTYQLAGDYWARVILGDGRFAEVEVGVEQWPDFAPVALYPELFKLPGFDGFVVTAAVDMFATGFNVAFWRFDGCALVPFVDGNGGRLLLNGPTEYWNCRPGGEIEIIRNFEGAALVENANWQGNYYTVAGVRLISPDVPSTRYGILPFPDFENAGGCEN